MDLTLSSDDFARLQGSMVVLLDPTVDFTAWRTGVNARVRALLETDEDVLYLPRAAVARPGRSGRGASTQSASPQGLIRIGHGGRPGLDVIVRSAVFPGGEPAVCGRELADAASAPLPAPLRGRAGVVAYALDTVQPPMVAAALAFRQGQAADARHRGRSERRLKLLRLLAPAFELSVSTQLRLMRERGRLALALVDGVADAALLSDSAGGILGENAALTRLLRGDRDAEFIRQEMLALATSLRRSARRRTRSRTSGASTPSATRETWTAEARYRLSACAVGVTGARAEMLIMVLAVRMSDEACSERVLRERFGFTEREVEVGRLLADGRSNAAIAQKLKISPHTARHHTERVLGKLGVHSRGAVRPLLRAD